MWRRANRPRRPDALCTPRRGSLRHLEGDGREVCMEPALIRGGEIPAHDLGMSANEKVGERHGRNRRIGSRHSLFPILQVCRGAGVSRRGGHIEDLDAPTAYPVGDRRWVGVSDTNLGQAHRIDGGTVTRHGAGNCISRPFVERRGGVEGEDKYVGNGGRCIF